MIRIEIDEVFDIHGNLVSRTERQVEVPDNTMTDVVAGLTEEQRVALLQALQGV